jgi:hypothetical protein
MTPALREKYSRDLAPKTMTSLFAIRNGGNYSSFLQIAKPDILSLLKVETGADASEIEKSFGVSTMGLGEFQYKDTMGAVAIRGCMPHACDEGATAIYIEKYVDGISATPKPALFVAWDLGSEVKLYNVSEPEKSEMKNTLLYIALIDNWENIFKGDPNKF